MAIAKHDDATRANKLAGGELATTYNLPSRGTKIKKKP